MTDAKSAEVIAAEAMAACLGSETEHENEYKVLPGTSVKCSMREMRTIRKFKEDVLAARVVYEALYGETAPIYDYDEKIPDGRNLENAHKDAFDKAMKVLRDLWGFDVQIHALTSTGHKVSETYTGPFVSLRFIIRGGGKFRCGNDMLRCGMVPEMFDKSIYKKEGMSQLMRVWGASKEGENRPMKYICKGIPKTLEEVNIEDPDVATYMFEETLAQNVNNEELIEVEEGESEIVKTDQNLPGIGKNGKPYGSDIKITCEGEIRELCVMAGWFQEVNRGFFRWCHEMWMLQNISDDLNINLDKLMIDVSKVWNGPHKDDSVENIKSVSKNRSVNMKRKNLGNLRREAETKNPDAYILWMDKVGIPIEVEPTDGAPRMIFINHNKFVKSTISLEMAYRWARETLVLVENRGCPYFLTRNMETCKYTNRQIEVWSRAKQKDIAACLDTTVYVKHPESYLAKLKAEIEEKLKHGAKVPSGLQHSADTGVRYFNFGIGSKDEPGFFKHAVIERVMPVASHEDFIPYLARRIPDKYIADAIADKLVINVFKGFPVESVEYKQEGEKYENSRLQSHLRDIICHGDQKEFEHLEGTIADMIQRPYRISNVAHVFHGRQGSGKSLLLQMMRRLIGVAHVMEFDDINTYFRNFNEDHSQAILKVMEEVSDKGDGFINNSKLKAEITKTMIRIEIKNAAIISMRNCARMWFISNNRNTLHVEHDDRRYTYHEVLDTFADNKEYFTPMWNALDDETFVRNAFEYFAELKYDEEFVCHAHATKYKEEQKIKSLPLPMKFLNDLMASDFEGCEHDGDKVGSVEFLNAYLAWAGPSNTIKRSGVLADKLAEMKLEKPTQQYINGNRRMAYVLNKDNVRNLFRVHLKTPDFEFLPAGHI